MKNLIISLIFLSFIVPVSARFYYEDQANIPLWAEDAIDAIRDENIMKGFPDGTFQPDRTLNRAEALVTLFRLKKIDESTAEKSAKNFSDVGSTDWFFLAVNKAVEEGWITGFPDGSFRPAKELNRAEWATLLQRAFDLEVDPENIPSFQDIPASVWYSDPIFALYDTDLIRYPQAQMFEPERGVSRAEAAWVISQVLQKPRLMGTSQANDFSGNQQLSSREIAYPVRDLNINKQGVTSTRKLLTLETNADETPREISPGNWAPLGNIRLMNPFDDRVKLNSMEVKLRFDKSSNTYATYFDLRINGQKVEKAQSFTNGATILFSGLDLDILAGQEKVFQIEIKTNDTFVPSKNFAGAVYVVDVDATTFASFNAAEEGSPGSTNYQKTPTSLDNKGLTPFVVGQP